MKRIMFALILAAAITGRILAIDTTPPVLGTVTVSPATASGGTALTLTFTATDAGSGVNTNAGTRARLLGPGGQQSCEFYNFTLESGTLENGTFTKTVTLNTYAENGVWSLQCLYLYDAAGNYKYNDSNNDYTPVTVTVTNPSSDNQAPVLVSAQLSPASPTPGTTLTVTINATDTPSGVGTSGNTSSQCRLTSPDNSQYEDILFSSAGGATYTGTATLLPTAKTGLWTMQCMLLFDNVGNVKNYSYGSGQNVSFFVNNGGVAFPLITNIAPQTWENTSAVTMTVTGNGFYGGTGADNVSSVKLGSTPYAYQTDSDTQLRIVIPAELEISSDYVQVTTGAGTTVNLGNNTYYTMTGTSFPKISAVNPASCLNTAPVTVTVTGTSFWDASCDFSAPPFGRAKSVSPYVPGLFIGETELSYVNVGGSGATLIAVIPAAFTPGLYDIKFRNYDHYSRAKAVTKFTVLAPSEIKLTNNLFRPSQGGRVTAAFWLQTESFVKVTVYNSNGQLIRTLISENRGAGSYTDVGWDGKNDAGEAVGSGTYIVFIETNTYKDKKKVIIVR